MQLDGELFPCGKHIHDSHAKALAHLVHLKQRGPNSKRERRRPLNAFWCRVCGAWHVGHKPRRMPIL